MADSREFGYAREAREAKQRMRNGASSRDLRYEHDGGGGEGRGRGSSGGEGGGGGGRGGGRRLEVDFGGTERFPSAEEVTGGRTLVYSDEMDGDQVV